jgi:magnesium transporter
VNPTAQLLEPEVCELIREGHYAELRDALHGVHPADTAEIFSSIEPSRAALGFRFLQRDDAAMVFSYLEPERQAALIRELGQEGALRVVEAMTPDDRIRLLDELPEEVAHRLMAELPAETRKVTQAILGYPERSVGRLMTPDYVRVRPDWTAAQALDHIRRHGRDAETVNVVYVVDEQGRLIDDVRLRQLLFAEPGAPVESLMNRSFVALRADQDQEEAVDLLTRYDRVALPVVDTRGVLLGIVTHDDVADVARQAATEDMQKMGGMEALDEPYMRISLWRLARKRGGWLAALFLGEMLTASAMTHYEDRVQQAVVLSLFLPLIISSGGNSGSQASTLIIRAMALKEITVGDWFRVFRRELLTGLLLGGFLGTIGMARILLWRALGWDGGRYTEHYVLVGLTIACSLVGVVLWGSLSGSMLPFVLRRMKLDPAAISAPLVATLVDVTGLVIYFTTATLILRGTLL